MMKSNLSHKLKSWTGDLCNYAERAEGRNAPTSPARPITFSVNAHASPFRRLLVALTLSGLLTVAISAGCKVHGNQPANGSFIPQERPSSRLTEQQMISMVMEWATNKGIALNDFTPPRTTHPIVILGRLHWSAHFIGKGAALPTGERLIAEGDSFTVYIDDKTGEMHSMGGM